MRSYPGSGRGHQDQGARQTAPIGPIALAGAAAVCAWAWTAPPAIGASAIGAALAALPLLALWTAHGRATAAALASAYRLPLGAFGVAVLALLAPALAATAADGRMAAALRDVAALAGLCLGAFGVATLAATGRWRAVNATLLTLGAGTAAASVAMGLTRGDADALALFPDRDAGAVFFALVCAQALVTLGDELGRRAPPGRADALAPLGRRTLLPVLAGLTAILMIAAAGTRLGAAAATATLALAAAVWTFRERRARAFRVAAAGLAVAVAGLAFAGPAPDAAGTALTLWIDRVGPLCAGLIGAACAAALAQIALSEDRGRRPARGLALAIAAATLATAAAALSAPAAAAPVIAWAAMQIGLAAGVVDLAARRQGAGQLVTAAT